MMEHDETPQRLFGRTLISLSVVAAGLIEASLITEAAHAAGHQMMVTVDPGERLGLSDWVAQKRLDLTGATRLFGDDSTPIAASVAVDECDQNGNVIAPRPCQFDVESQEPLVGTLIWPVEATPAKQPRYFRVSWADRVPEGPAATYEDSPLKVSDNAENFVVSNAEYQVTHDKTGGGLWSVLTFRPSGTSNDQSVWRDGVGDYELRYDSAPEVRVVFAGPLRVVVEVRARYLNEKGQSPPSHPVATYRYTHLAGQHYVHVKATVEQNEAVAWPELRIGDLRPDTSFFTQYWMDHFSGKPWDNLHDLIQLGSHTFPTDSHGLLIGDRAYFALAGHYVTIWDAGKSPDSYLRVYWEPWDTTRMEYAFHALFDGSEGALGRIVGRQHKIQKFTHRHLHTVPPRVVLDVGPLREKTANQLTIYKSRTAALPALPAVRKEVAHFALGVARMHLADGDVALNDGAFARVRDLFQAAAEEAEKISLEDLTWNTIVRHGDAIGLEMNTLLILINRDMAIAIDRKSLKLRGLFNRATEKEFVSISSRVPAPGLVDVTLLTPDHREVGASGFDEAKHTHRWRQTDEGIELILRWQGANVPQERGVLDVEAMIRTGPQGMTHWSCRVQNDSRDLGLRYVKFPVIGPLHAGTDQDPTDYDRFGSVNPTAKTGDVHLPLAYYGSRGGVYYHPQDAHWYEKRRGARADAATRTATFGHTYIAVNSHGEQVKSFEPTYEVALGVFQGDWYDVARLYRRWAVKQPWCAKGTLAERDDLPQWIKEVDLWEAAGGQTQQSFDDMLSMVRNFGRPISLWNPHWMFHSFDNKYPDYFPPKIGKEAFTSSLAEGHKHGLTYMPYVNAYIYATDAPSFTEEAARNGAKFLDGTPRQGTIEYGEKYMPYVAMCPATKFWQDKFSEIGRKLIQEYDCDAIYYDQVDVFHMECGDPSHGHPLGGGNSWTEGVRELYRRVRREALAAGKKIVFSSEFYNEQFIGDVEVPLRQMSTGDSRGEFIDDVIYHDYVIAFDYYLGARPVVPFVGSLFIAGKPGPTGMGGPNHLGGDQPNERTLRFMRYLSDVRRQFGLKYLNHGARLRNPQILTDLPIISRGAETKAMPAVITSAWEAPNGDVGCFFMNISDEPQTFEFVIDLSHCALESMGTYTVTQHVLGNQPTTVDERNTGKVASGDTLESANVFMIEFSPHERHP